MTVDQMRELVKKCGQAIAESGSHAAFALFVDAIKKAGEEAVFMELPEDPFEKKLANFEAMIRAVALPTLPPSSKDCEP